MPRFQHEQGATERRGWRRLRRVLDASEEGELAKAFQDAPPPAPDVVNALSPVLQAAIALRNKNGRLRRSRP